MTPDEDRAASPSTPHADTDSATGSAPSPTPIEELAGLPDFPQCALGQLIEIRGYVGVVADIVHNSIKVRSPEGTTQSFNFHRLRTLYAPVVHQEPAPASYPGEQGPTAMERILQSPAKVPAPKRDVIPEPDFSAPVQSISEFAIRLDFPQCVLGQHVDIAGFKGVAVEIAKGSVRVRSAEGTGRSYNAELLQKLYGKR